jgi:hypothetical protein
MAFEVPVLIHSFTAASDMSAVTAQYTLVRQAPNGHVHPCTAVTDIPIGVLQNTPERGKLAEVMLLGISKVRVGATDISTAGFLLGVDATSRAAAIVAGTATTTFVVGRVLADSGDNDGSLLTAAINCLSLARGA